MRNRRLPIPSILGLAALLLVSVLVVPVLAGAPLAQPTEDGDGNRNDQVADFTYDSLFACPEEDRNYAVYRTGDFGNAVDTEIQVDETEGAEMVEVRFRLPSLPGGEYLLERSCSNDTGKEVPDSETVSFSFSRVMLTKTAAGEVPSDASFIVNTACDVSDDPFLDVDREFGADGGDAQVVFYQYGEDVECIVDETEDAGAETVTYDPESQTVTYDGFSDGSSRVTVTNAFPEPSPEEPTPDVDDTVEEAEPAEPVEAEPDFTG